MCLGFRVQGSGFRVQGSGFRAELQCVPWRDDWCLNALCVIVIINPMPLQALGLKCPKKAHGLKKGDGARKKPSTPDPQPLTINVQSLTPNHIQGDGQRLAKEVLAEIPHQLTSYMKAHNIKPQVKPACTLNRDL